MSKLKPFLADTWWYGMSNRISEEDLLDLARLRVKQGFDAIQIVVGIPPEVGPENKNALSEVGFPWNLKGEVNAEYLKLTFERIKQLNEIGLKAIIYGAWGQQVDWLGSEFMKLWWSSIVKHLDGLDIIYCVSGESDLWIGEESKKLLPDKSTEDSTNHLKKRLGRIHLVRNIVAKLKGSRHAKVVINPQSSGIHKEERKNNWSEVLEFLNTITEKPIIIHPISSKFSYETVNNPELLAAITTQTGHDPNSRSRLWKDPQKSLAINPDMPFINLEPWYEGIVNSFYLEDQIFAFWSTLMAGATSFCYGAHGIWNIGDREFLSQWGLQTFDNAKKLQTPNVLGTSFTLLKNLNWNSFSNINIDSDGDNLKSIKRTNVNNESIVYYPEAKFIPEDLNEFHLYDPLTGKFVSSVKNLKQLVCISKSLVVAEA